MCPYKDIVLYCQYCAEMLHFVVRIVLCCIV